MTPNLEFHLLFKSYFVKKSERNFCLSKGMCVFTIWLAVSLGFKITRCFPIISKIWLDAFNEAAYSAPMLLSFIICCELLEIFSFLTLNWQGIR